MKYLIILLFSIIIFQASAQGLFNSDRSHDSDPQMCNEIREEAKNLCEQEVDFDSCYIEEVDRMVDDWNSNTDDLPGGGEAFCSL